MKRHKACHFYTNWHFDKKGMEYTGECKTHGYIKENV